MSKFVATCVLFFAVSSACTAADKVLVLTAESLAQSKDKLLGRTVQVDGCIHIHHHGMQIVPCGEHDWRQITLADDPEDLLISAFGPGRLPFGSLEASFYGRIVSEEYDWPKHGFSPTLRIERISNIGKHEP